MPTDLENENVKTEVYHLKCGESMPAPGSTKRRIYGPSKLTMYIDANSSHGVLEDWDEGACSDPQCENEDCVRVRQKGAARKALRKTQATIRKNEAAKARKTRAARKRNLTKARKAKRTQMKTISVPGIGKVGFSVPVGDDAK